MAEEKKDVQKVEQGQRALSKTPAEMIEMAVNGNADLEKLEKLLEIQERWEKNEARKAYHRAMAEFKANAPEIVKDKSVSFGQGKASYNHASLYNVTKCVNEALSKHGLSASWQTAQNGAISVTCKITHVMGHSEETTLSAQSDTSGSKNAIQAIGSTITYLQRYSLLALTGLATMDQDDDGQASEVEYIGDASKNQILDMIADTEASLGKLLEYLKVESLDLLPKSDYQKAVAVLAQRKKDQKGGEK